MNIKKTFDPTSNTLNVKAQLNRNNNSISKDINIIGKILEKHSGALFLESEPGRTKFTVILPVDP